MAYSTARRPGAPDVPIFLQKAYHMIDTCDPKICSWSDDGLTFVVKDVSLFENTVIPQFFKHNKFSSFVRQLNFYGFRKVKFTNSLKIDRKREKETAKYWGYRHDKFRKGRKDLLAQIKRTPNASAPLTKGAVVPRAPTSSSAASSKAPNGGGKPEEVSHLKGEMQDLKQRIASMTKNIDELTDLVKKVSVKDEEGSSPTVSPGSVGLGNKRKKLDSAGEQEMEDLPMMPDWTPSTSDLVGDSLLLGEPFPDVPTSGGSSPAPSPTPSDDAFVDDLFQAFADEDPIPGLDDLDESAEGRSTNKPDPALMQRIEDSLATIPRDMHEMVANRLIDAISDTQPIAKSAASLFPSEGSGAESQVVQPDRSISMDEGATSAQPQAREGASGSTTAASIPLPLAVATLKTILAEYGVLVECRRAPCKESLDRSRFTKSLPVVPMHA
ncbi:hypothetical protein ACHAXT_008489 [Thalassiosira profunda]